MKQKRFTKEFEEEAVRLLRTSGRTKREIGKDLGVSLSTLTRWLSQRRDLEMEEPDRRPPGEDAAGELKRKRGAAALLSVMG
jgi:transposase